MPRQAPTRRAEHDGEAFDSDYLDWNDRPPLVLMDLDNQGEMPDRPGHFTILVKQIASQIVASALR